MELPVIGILLLSLAVTPVPESLACSCVQASFDERVDLADVIFVGTAASLDGDGATLYWSFADVVFVKGAEQAGIRPVVVGTLDNSAACGYGFDAGAEYAVFAAVDGGKMQTGLCNGNVPTSQLTPSQIRTLSELQVSGIDLGNDGQTKDAGESAGERACDESEVGLNGCVHSGLVMTMIFLAAAGIAGFAIIRKRRA